MKRVIVTGGAGFIGSAFIWKLNREGIEDILVVDSLGVGEKWRNLSRLRFADYLHKSSFLQQITTDTMRFAPEAVVHMGACSSTTERNADYLMANNYQFTRSLAEWAAARGLRFIYAGSAATYGNGESGFTDDADLSQLTPLNVYGYSKLLFDRFAERTGLLRQTVGLKFFNVFGPNEYHKGEMASVVFKAFHQIKERGQVSLFRSCRADYADGEQMRDFIYVKDCIEVLWWLLTHPEVNGLFNLGTGRARSWNCLAKALFSAMDLPVRIEYIPMPEHLRANYQYFTQASMDRLKSTGCPTNFQSLEDSVTDYVRNHLQTDFPWLSSATCTEAVDSEQRALSNLQTHDE
jgi:ADP-L-glycero-D-manno-heptose 6-epimerase